MNNDLYYIEQKNLERYYHRYQNSSHGLKLLQLQYLWKFLHQSFLYAPLIEEIRSNNKNFWNIGNGILYSPNHPIPDDALHRIYAIYFALDILLKGNPSVATLQGLGNKYNPEKHRNDQSSDFKVLNDLFLDELIHHFMNRSNKTNSILGLLKKYKHRTECFNTEVLSEQVMNQSSKGEALLKRDLHLYLSDQGLDIHMEPLTKDGRADFIAVETSGMEKAVIEAKVIKPSAKSKQSIIDGYHQTYTYLRNHGLSQGYLVVYNLCPETLIFQVSLGATFPYLIRDNKMIFFVVIDLYPHTTTASNRGDTGTIIITESDLLK